MNHPSRIVLNKLPLVAAVVLISLSMQGCAKKTADAQTLIADARNYQEKGDSNAAIIQLKNALQSNPDNSEARYLLGTIYNKTGDFQSAEKELRKALSLGMSPAKVIPDLGQTLLSLGQFQQVLDETEKLSGEKNSAEISTLRGNSFLALGKAKEAKDLFELALKDKPDFSDAFIGLARYSLSTRDIEAASNFAEQAVTRDPKNADAWLFKGDLLRMQGKTDPALAAYDQVVKLKQNSFIAYLNKAALEIGAGRFEAADTDIKAARKAAPGSLMVLYTQALLDFNQGKPSAALDSLQQVLSKVPEHMPSRLLAGAVQAALGSAPQAEQHLKYYLEREPGNVYARKLLASVLLKSRQTQRAIDVLAPALKVSQQDPQLLALAGESYMQANDFTKATEYFEKASNIAPQSATLHTALGMSKLGQGQSSRAVAELEKATNLDAKSPQAGILLVMTHLRLKEYDKAMAAASALEKANPDNPLIQNLKGGIYLNKQDRPSARASFEKALVLQPSYFPAVANLAQLDLQEKKPEAAKKRFETVLGKDKKNIQAMTALANLALSQGKTKEATDWLERSVAENPDAPQPTVLLTTHYLRLGDKQKSLTLAKKLQGAHPHDPEVLDLLAQAQLANNDKTAALESYNRLAAMQPESPVVQLRIASIQLANENPTAASDALKKALDIKPDYLDAQLAQVALESRQGNYEKAMAISHQIQRQQKKSPVGYIAEGDLLMAQKKPVLAAKAYEHAFDVSKSGPALLRLHASLSQAGKIPEANTRLVQWLKEHPEDAASRMYLAGVYLATQNNRGAIEQYQIVLKEAPTYVPALNNLATAYQQEKNPLALEYAEKAYQLAPGSAAVMDTLGWILIEQGNITRGLPLLEKAVSLAPEAADIRYHLAAARAKSGDNVQARRELEQLLAGGKQFPSLDQAKLLLKQIQ
jgi:putative PEP-CTERM system TPR-repeat lipoprotein